MKIRLLAHDSLIPNFAIMKISTYHKQLGDDVAWYDESQDLFDTDILYISKVFTFSKIPVNLPMNPDCKIIIGGTGYDIKNTLPDEIESITELDYSLYPDCDYSIIFTTRGCIRHCPFCIVHDKEGIIHDIPLTNLNPKGKYIRVQDNNFFASTSWKARLEALKSYNKPLEFNSGLDLRILTEEMCEELSKCKIYGIKTAFDDYNDKKIIISKIELLKKYIQPNKITCYVLVGYKQKQLVNEDIERVNLLWDRKIYPFVMVYQDFNNPNYKRDRSTRRFARWVNNRFLFKSCTWEEYQKTRKDRL